jgi:hypothetical protein
LAVGKLNDVVQLRRGQQKHPRIAPIFDPQYFKGRHIKSHWSRREIMDDLIEFESQISAAAEEKEVTDKAKDMVRQIYWAFGWEVSSEQLERDFQ